MRKIPRICGVYLMMDWSSGSHYVGSSYHYHGRCQEHIRRLEKRKHLYFKEFKNAQRNKALTFFLLQECDLSIPKRDLLKLEQEWANCFPQRVNRYKNVTGIGYPHTISAAGRARISAAGMGNKRRLGLFLSAETRAKISRAGLGKKRSPETCARMSKGKLGNKYAAGRKLSPEHKEKLRLANLGKIHTPEHRAKTSAAQKGRPGKKHTPESRQKISDGLRGRKLSPEHCKKISAFRRASKFGKAKAQGGSK